MNNNDFENARNKALDHLYFSIDEVLARYEAYKRKRDYKWNNNVQRSLFDESPIIENIDDINESLLKRIKNEIKDIRDLPTESYCYKAKERNIKEAEEKWINYDNEVRDVNDRIKGIIDDNFVDLFNKTFTCEEYRLCKGFFINFRNRKEKEKEGIANKKWIVDYLIDQIYFIRREGAHIGIDTSINGKWINIDDFDKCFIRQDIDKLFYIKYKISEMYPKERYYKGYHKFDFLAVKINSSEAEWKIIK